MNLESFNLQNLVRVVGAEKTILETLVCGMCDHVLHRESVQSGAQVAAKHSGLKLRVQDSENVFQMNLESAWIS